MNFKIVPKKDLSAELAAHFELLDYTENEIKKSLSQLERFLIDCREDLYVGIEDHYVDKVYRDSYYKYYSSKLKHYKRNCIRLSFFQQNYSPIDFFNNKKQPKIQRDFLGFLVLRPTPPKVVGRNILRPDLFENGVTYNIVYSNAEAAINGLKLKIQGFPHASQDGE